MSSCPWLARPHEPQYSAAKAARISQWAANVPRSTSPVESVRSVTEVEAYTEVTGMTSVTERMARTARTRGRERRDDGKDRRVEEGKGVEEGQQPKGGGNERSGRKNAGDANLLAESGTHRSGREEKSERRRNVELRCDKTLPPLPPTTVASAPTGHRTIKREVCERTEATGRSRTKEQTATAERTAGTNTSEKKEAAPGTVSSERTVTPATTPELTSASTETTPHSGPQPQSPDPSPILPPSDPASHLDTKPPSHHTERVSEITYLRPANGGLSLRPASLKPQEASPDLSSQSQPQLTSDWRPVSISGPLRPRSLKMNPVSVTSGSPRIASAPLAPLAPQPPSLQPGPEATPLQSGPGPNALQSSSGQGTLQPGLGLSSLPSGLGLSSVQSGPGPSSLHSGPGPSSLHSGPGRDSLQADPSVPLSRHSEHEPTSRRSGLLQPPSLSLTHKSTMPPVTQATQSQHESVGPASAPVQASLRPQSTRSVSQPTLSSTHHPSRKPSSQATQYAPSSRPATSSSTRDKPHWPPPKISLVSDDPEDVKTSPAYLEYERELYANARQVVDMMGPDAHLKPFWKDFLTPKSERAKSRRSSAADLTETSGPSAGSSSRRRSEADGSRASRALAPDQRSYSKGGASQASMPMAKTRPTYENMRSVSQPILPTSRAPSQAPPSELDADQLNRALALVDDMAHRLTKEKEGQVELLRDVRQKLRLVQELLDNERGGR